MPATCLLVLTTYPDADGAAALAAALVDAGLAACVNVLPPMTSIYQWRGRRETGAEHLMIIKTRAELYRELERAIVAAHPYELPEVIAVPVKNGLAGYLDWIRESTAGALERGT